jgi:hypothetical protein
MTRFVFYLESLSLSLMESAEKLKVVEVMDGLSGGTGSLSQRLRGRWGNMRALQTMRCCYHIKIQLIII